MQLHAWEVVDTLCSVGMRIGARQAPLRLRNTGNSEENRVRPKRFVTNME
jgi:hypothetical protein